MTPHPPRDHGAARRLIGLMVVLIMTVAACSSGGGSPTAPTGATLTLTTSTTSLSPNGSAVITAQMLTSSGQPQANVAVSFSASIGSVDPPELVTDASGSATVIFSAGTASGMAMISARSGNLSATPLSLAVGTSSIGRVLLAAEPPSLPSGGGASTITATVTDAKGNPLPTMPVAFTTTAGTVVPANAKTDANGQVLTTLSSKSSATVTAVAGISPNDGSSGVAQVSGSLLVALGARPQPAITITPSADPVAGTPMTFTIGVIPPTGSTTTIQDVTIWFGDGESSSLGAATGAAIIAQHTYAVGGSYTVTVTATDSGGGTTTASAVIAVGFSAPLAVMVTAGPMAPAGGGPNTIVTLTATVAPAGTVISGYQWDFGDGQKQATTANTLQHLYASAGLYTVTVTATDAATGMTATGSVPLSTSSARPAVTIAASPSPVARSTTTFTLGVTPAPGSNTTITSVRLDYGDGTTPVDLGGVSGPAIVAQHAYANPGSFTATVTAIDTGGGLATASVIVVVASSVAPTVSLSASGGAIAGSPVTFTVAAAPGSSGGTVTSVVLSFGDGSGAVDLGAVGSAPITTQHAFPSGGSYTVTATATDSNGVSGTNSIVVVVAAPGAPTVSMSASPNAVAGSAVTFTITAASGTGGAPLASLLIEYGDGGNNLLGPAGGSPFTTQHTYTAAGSYAARVTVTDTSGNTNRADIVVVVAAPGAPTVSVSASANPVVNTTTTLTVTVNTPAGVTVQSAVLQFGDGGSVNLGAISGSATAQHVYTSAGTYTASATVTTSTGTSATGQTAVVVASAPRPTVSITAPSNITTQTVTSFTIATTPATPTSTVTNVTVSFGDGTSIDLGSVGASTTIQHVYTSAGPFTVTATATDSGGGTATATTPIVVVAPIAVTVTAAATRYTLIPITFTIGVSPAPGVTVQSVSVNWGDSSVENLGSTFGNPPATRTHTYNTATTYTVSVTATAAGGVSVSASTTVSPVAPPGISVDLQFVSAVNLGLFATVNLRTIVNPSSSVVGVQSAVLTFGNGGAISVPEGTFTISHVYETLIGHTATLTVVDSVGRTYIDQVSFGPFP